MNTHIATKDLFGTDSFVRQVAMEIGVFLKILCKNRVIKETQRQLCAQPVQVYHISPTAWEPSEATLEDARTSL
jgi:hypothetical protein